MTIINRKSPKSIKRMGGPTKLTAGNSGLIKGCKYESILGRKESRDTNKIDPITGPSIVPKPPITDIMSGSKELEASKILKSKCLITWA